MPGPIKRVIIVEMLKNKINVVTIIETIPYKKVAPQKIICGLQIV